MCKDFLVDIDCGFCAELQGFDRENNLLKKIITPQTGLKSRIVLETESFVVVPTIGAFIKGYFLILSKEHYDCIGKMPKSSFDELSKLQATVKDLIREKYGAGSVEFEHGSISCSNRFGGCINHAHLHIVPCNDNLIGLISKYNMKGEKITGINELTQYANIGIPYLFFEDYDCQKYLIKGDIVPSQFFRMIIAEYYSCHELWDWRQHFFLENIIETIADLKR